MIPEHWRSLYTKCCFSTFIYFPASVTDLKFLNLDGIEYSFYKTQEAWGMGYMRFQPLQERGMKRNKSNTLVRLNAFHYILVSFHLLTSLALQRFLSLYGEFVIEVKQESEDGQKYVMKSGDFIEINMGK